jgi:hypothetical protein
VFASMTWILWTTRNKMGIEHIFLQRASDSIFKFLAFMQQWYPTRSVGSGTRSGWTACWRIFLWRLVIHLCSPAVDVLSRFLLELYLFLSFGHVCAVAPADGLSVVFHTWLLNSLYGCCCFIYKAERKPVLREHYSEH